MLNLMKQIVKINIRFVKENISFQQNIACPHTNVVSMTKPAEVQLAAPYSLIHKFDLLRYSTTNTQNIP